MYSGMGGVLEGETEEDERRRSRYVSAGLCIQNLCFVCIYNVYSLLATLNVTIAIYVLVAAVVLHPLETVPAASNTELYDSPNEFEMVSAWTV